ncbi:MAG TPA: nucleotide exchange factor GrpE [Acidimicrobiales bacterium]|nr:nucleotide exchange factor GrpE [Acidimicrobiales bacterium]
MSNPNQTNGGAADPLADVVADTGADTPAGEAAAAASPGAGAEPVDLAAEMADAAVDLAAAEAAADVELDLEVAAVARQRDDYLDALRRLQADFENYKKRVEKQKVEHVERAAGELVSKILPVCDTADLAIAHGGGEEVKQIWTALFDALEREGLERIDPVGAPFDPTVHDAVAHEPGDGGNGGPHVVEVMRAGYRWKGRVLRHAMVKVRG